MSSLFKKALHLLTGDDIKAPALKMPKKRTAKKLTERGLLQLESEIGRTVFGPVPAGRTREFFNLDANTWIWYEEYKDQNGVKQSATTRYEVKHDGVLKAQDGYDYSYVEGEELRNLTLAVQSYYEQVMTGVYGRDPRTGQKFAQ